MKNLFVKGTALTLTAALTLMLAACGGKTSDSAETQAAGADAQATADASEAETTEATEETFPEIDTLQAYYDGNFDPANSGCGFLDFDEDGAKEMIVADYTESPTHMLTGFTLYHYKVSNGEVAETDRFTVDSETYQGFLPAQDSVAAGMEEPDGGEELMVYLDQNKTILCNLYERMNNWSVRYMRFTVQQDKFVLEKHLWDPGETSGLSISDYDTYFGAAYDPLYEEAYDVPGDSEGQGSYDSYLAVLEGEIGGGYQWRQYHGAHAYTDAITKGEVLPGDAANLILNFKNY